MVRSPSSAEPPPVIQEPRLVRNATPEYPQAAAAKGVEGFVEVRFNVSTQGTVSDVTIVQSQPAEIFDRAAIAAVRRWKYNPKFVDGVPVESRMQVRLKFKLGPDSR
jgi:protein TonB